MSRVGNSPIKLPDGVNVTAEGTRLVAKGIKGELVMALPSVVDVSVGDGVVTVSLREDDACRSVRVRFGPISTIWC